MNLLGLIVRRLAAVVTLLVAVVVLNFILIHAAPGDAVDALVASGGGASEEAVVRLRQSYGLDQPIHVQLVRYVGKALTGDLGVSFHYGLPVTTLIAATAPATLLLAATALFFAVVFGTLLGILAARHRNAWPSHLVSLLSLLGYATPSFWLGIMMLLFFAYVLGIFPAFGMRSTPPPADTLGRVLDFLHHLVVPAFTLTLLFMASYSRLARASMIEVLQSDYIKMARAKGLRTGTIIYKHSLRNAAIPIVTMIGLDFGNLLSSAVLIENVFSWPGIGPLAFESALRRDYPVLIGVLITVAAMVIVANVAVDLVYRIIDPRIRGAAA